MVFDNEWVLYLELLLYYNHTMKEVKLTLYFQIHPRNFDRYFLDCIFLNRGRSYRTQTIGCSLNKNQKILPNKKYFFLQTVLNQLVISYSRCAFLLTLNPSLVTYRSEGTPNKSGHIFIKYFFAFLRVMYFKDLKTFITNLHKAYFNGKTRFCPLFHIFAMTTRCKLLLSLALGYQETEEPNDISPLFSTII